MSRVITITSPSGATLKTKNKFVDDDIAVQVSDSENIVASNIKSGVSILGVSGTYEGFVPSGTINISNNGTYSVSAFAEAVVSVPGLVPSGTLEISSNGVYDVGNYASASVNVSLAGVQTVDELVNKTISYYEGALLTSNSYLYSFGSYMFFNCSNLSYVKISLFSLSTSSAFLKVGMYAFDGCSMLSSINIFDSSFTSNTSNTVYYFENAAFSNCTLLSTSLKLRVSSPVGTWAFYKTGITEIDLSFAYFTVIASINNGVFKDCSNLSKIHVYAYNNSSMGNLVSIGSQAFEGTAITEITSSTFEFYKSNHSGNYGVSFNTSTFHSCSNLSKVDMPYTANQIPANCFHACSNLETFRVYKDDGTPLGGQLTYINDAAFSQCYNLSSFVLDVPLPSTLTLNRSAFAYCSKLSKFNYISSTQTISSYCFFAAGLRSWEASTTQYLGSYAFGNALSLKFFKNSKANMNGNNVFRSCQNLSYALCATLQQSTFANCYNLKSFMCGVGVSSSCFQYCSSLESFYLSGTTVVNLQNTNAFAWTPINQSSHLGYFGSIYVRSSLLDSYKAATNWVQFSDRFVGVTDEEMEQIITDYMNVSYVEE